KKLAVLWKTAKIDNVESLLKACKNDELSAIPGFGAKTQANIINAIETLNAGEDRFHYGFVADMADALVASLQKIFKTELISLCGEIRRKALTVGEFELVMAIPQKKFAAASLRRVLNVSSSSPQITKAHTLDELPVTIYHTSSKNFYWELFNRTGNEAHVAALTKKLDGQTAFTSEQAIYARAGMPFIEPELRENTAEWKFVKAKNRKLVTAEDIKGVVHNHTTWSDGVDSLKDFATACIRRGYEYTVISDHSKNAHYAGGLKEEKVLRQMAEIDALNKKVAPFRIFKSIECDILVSGELDYDSSLLQKFDLVIASVHQLLKMNEKKATARLIKAIENPFTTILGHMTGRQLLIRPGYPVDFKKIIDACAANQVVIELNTNPYRLDMDWSHIPYALEKGVMISLNPDAHSIGEIDNIRWGVDAARKGGLTPDMTWNAMGLKELESWLKTRKKAPRKTRELIPG
ncbi:MAG: DNA polymerase/3'-5' exonuclease PolX, partial [Chitinophagaceae bacterium]|nr:DNA polymerase/3'-5' exonuclease PolX [Chitinophagaceae bacterium]